MGYEWDIPSGNLLQFAIDSSLIYLSNIGTFHSYVSLPEGNGIFSASI